MMPRVALALCALLVMTEAPRAQSPTLAASVQAAGGVTLVVFRSMAGVVTVPVAPDAAPGDTISGVVAIEPAGRTPEEQRQQRAALSALVLEVGDTRVSAGQGRYTWTIPRSLTRARMPMRLRMGGTGSTSVAEVQVPIDPLPTPVTARETRPIFELPADAQAGRTAVVRGAFDGRLSGKTVRVGTAPAEILAISPRRLVFRVPPQAGEQPVRVEANGVVVEGALRVLAVELRAPGTLARGATGTATFTVSGLRGARAPVVLAWRNLTPSVVRVERGDTGVVVFQPRDVTSDGTVVFAPTVVGVGTGAVSMQLTAASRPIDAFNVTTAVSGVLTGWEASTGILIRPPARDTIRGEVLEAQNPLDAFLLRQQMEFGADPRDLFGALLSHYCFDLRDLKLSLPLIVDRDPGTAPGIVLAAFGSQQSPRMELTPTDVRRQSFGNFLSGLIARVTGGAQAVGYLFLTSTPANAAITIDGQRKSEITNRRFVTSVGAHEIAITGTSTSCRERVQVEQYRTSVVSCPR